MKHGKHVVMLNVEADITIGRYLKAEARRAGVIYTGAAGDEPACHAGAHRLCHAASGSTSSPPARARTTRSVSMQPPTPIKTEARAAQHERAHAGRIRRRLEDHDRDGRHRQCDGLVPDVPGMHGPDAALGDLADRSLPRAPMAAFSRSAGRRRLLHRQGCRSRRLLHRRDRSTRAFSNAWSISKWARVPSSPFTAPSI